MSRQLVARGGRSHPPMSAWVAIAVVLAAPTSADSMAVSHMPTAPSARLELWLPTTGELLRRSTSPPLYTRFSIRKPNVSGVVTAPPLDAMCAWHEEMRSWSGHVVLAGGWVSPGGCSIEERARVLALAGVSAAIFEGTEGTPLIWDGSDLQDIGIVAMVLGYAPYADVAAAAEEHDSSLTIWLAPDDSPLLHN